MREVFVCVFLTGCDDRYFTLTSDPGADNITNDLNLRQCTLVLTTRIIGYRGTSDDRRMNLQINGEFIFRHIIKSMELQLVMMMYHKCFYIK